jgi:hypothetical protein
VDTYQEMALWVRYFILSMIVNGWARRNEWCDMKLIKHSDLNQPEDHTHNYIIFTNKRNKPAARIYFNVYKTSGTYGEQSYDITQPELLRLLPKLHLILSKFSPDNFLVVKQDKTQVSTDHFAKWLQPFFNQFADGKELNTTTLRHIIASSQYSNEDIEKQEKREEQAEKMGHDIETSFNTYVKKH